MQNTLNCHTQVNDKINNKCIVDSNVKHLKYSNGIIDNNISLPSPSLISMVTTNGDLDKSDLCELRNRMISQKWLLSKWVNLKEQELEYKCKHLLTSQFKLNNNSNQVTASGSNNHHNNDNSNNINSNNNNNHNNNNNCNLMNGHFDNLTNLISSKSRRVQFTGGINSEDDRKSIRHGPCCYSTEDSNDLTIECHKPALPFTRHCKKHILYNVDQLLFERCTAKSTTSPLTQCSNATFCIEKDRKALCIDHERLLIVDSTNDQINNDDDCKTTSTSGKGRKRPKSNLVTRSTRRRSNTKGKGKGNCDSPDALQPVSAGSTINRINNNHNTNINNNNSNTNHSSYSIIDGELMPSSHSVTLHNDNCDSTNHDSSSNTYPLGVDPHGDIPTGLDVDIHNLTAGDEALVASLVEDLPPLGTAPDGTVDANDSHTFDAEFNEVLNKLPAEAFHEIFSTDNHHNHLNHQTTPPPPVVTSNVVTTTSTHHPHPHSHPHPHPPPPPHHHRMHHQRPLQSTHHLSHQMVNKVPNADSTIGSIVMDVVDSSVLSPRVNSDPHSHTNLHHQSHASLSHQHSHHPPASTIAPQSVLKDCNSLTNGNCSYNNYLSSNVAPSSSSTSSSSTSTSASSSSSCTPVHMSNGISSSSSVNSNLVVHSHVPEVNSIANVSVGSSVTTVGVNSHCIVNDTSMTPVTPPVLPSNVAVNSILMSRSTSTLNNSTNNNTNNNNSSSSNNNNNVVAMNNLPSTVAIAATNHLPTQPPPQPHPHPPPTTLATSANDDLCGLATNILGFLTKEQQQQLNGLIDGALASGSLSSSPTLKHAQVSLDINNFSMTANDVHTNHINNTTGNTNITTTGSVLPSWDSLDSLSS